MIEEDHSRENCRSQVLMKQEHWREEENYHDRVMSEFDEVGE